MARGAQDRRPQGRPLPIAEGPNDIYLDIETTQDNAISVIGFYSPASGLVQIVGEEITPDSVDSALPAKGRLFTYNGHCFDLPCISKRLGLHLRERFESHDLRWVCQRHKLMGGQKTVEERIGFRRSPSVAGMDGIDAMWLWEQHCDGNPQALSLLLAYNKEDVEGIRAIRRHCAERGFLTTG